MSHFYFYIYKVLYLQINRFSYNFGTCMIYKMFAVDGGQFRYNADVATGGARCVALWSHARRSHDAGQPRRPLASGIHLRTRLHDLGNNLL